MPLHKSSDVPYGKGSLYHHLAEAQIRTQKRALKLNQGIDANLKDYYVVLQRHQDSVLDRREKAAKRIQRHIAELIAYQQYLQNFKVSNFISLKPGFKARQVTTPNSYQAYKTERRVMNVGFGLKALYPQIKETIERNCPERKREALRKMKLDAARKKSNFLIDRKLTNEAMIKEQTADSGSLNSTSGNFLETPKVHQQPQELKKLSYKHSETVVTVQKHVTDGLSSKQNTDIDSQQPRGLKPPPIVIGAIRKS